MVAFADFAKVKLLMWTIPVPCGSGSYLDQVNGCTTCGEGTYSAGGTVSLCSNCPSGKTVGRGDGISQNDCTWSKSRYFYTLYLS